MAKKSSPKGGLSATEFYGLKRRDAFVLVVGQKRLVGFEIRDAIDIQGDQFVDPLGELGVLLEISQFQFDDILGFELLDCWDIEEVFGEVDRGIELPIDEADLGVFVLVAEGVFLVFWGEVIGGDDPDSLAGGFSGVGKDTVIGLEFVDEGVDRAGRVCGPLIVVSQERFDLVEGEGRQVRLVEPVDGDAAFFDTIPPELRLFSWGDFPIVGHDGDRLAFGMLGLSHQTRELLDSAIFV